MTDILVLAGIAFLFFALLWAVRSDSKRTVEREAALRIETERTVQAQRALEDAPGVAQAAAQERPRRKTKK